MKRIIVIRHGESEGNQKKIIQGLDVDYGLTETGKNNIREIVNNNFELLSSCDKLVTSPLKRAYQTSEIIREKTGISFSTEVLLSEFNPGILAGKTHNECQKDYTEYYKIWCSRKDLDGIPGAESGEQLQARVIAFLLKYADKKIYNDIIVSHAGFIRCLVNTASGRDRTTPIEINNGVIHILDNPLENLFLEKRTRAMTSKVYIVNTYNGKYVLKRKDRKISDKDREEKRILEELSSRIPVLPVIVGLFDDSEGSSKVMKYIEGVHIYGRLDRKQEIALLKEFIKVRNSLDKVSSMNYEKTDLIHEMEYMSSSCTKSYTKESAKKILNNYRNINKLKNATYGLCHNDLNRDNILFDETEQIKAHFIDWEGLELCPKEYQLATFLTSSFFIEGYSAEEVMNIAQIIDSQVDKNFLSFLIQIRIFKGLYFFGEFPNSFVKSNLEVGNEILAKYYNANEEISKYRRANGLDIANSREDFGR